MADLSTIRSAISKHYDNRASKYDESWHPNLASLFTSPSIISPTPGSSILDLCTGTFLVGAAFSKVIGSNGKVFGVDISPEMLNVAKRRIEDLGISAHASVLYRDVLDLDTPIPDEAKYSSTSDSNVNVRIPKGQWDIISCCSAFVLLPKSPPSSILQYWKQYLRPKTGKMIIDFPTENTQLVSEAIFRLSRQRRTSNTTSSSSLSALDRDWISGPDSIRKEFENAGMVVELLHKTEPMFVVEYSGSEEEAVSHFEKAWNDPLLRSCFPQNMGEGEARNEFTKTWLEMINDLRKEKDAPCKIENRLYIVVAKQA